MAVGATFSLVGGINDIGMEERRRVYHVTGDESPTASLAIKGRTAGGPPRSGPPHWSIWQEGHVLHTEVRYDRRRK